MISVPITASKLDLLPQRRSSASLAVRSPEITNSLAARSPQLPNPASVELERQLCCRPFRRQVYGRFFNQRRGLTGRLSGTVAACTIAEPMSRREHTQRWMLVVTLHSFQQPEWKGVKREALFPRQPCAAKHHPETNGDKRSRRHGFRTSLAGCPLCFAPTVA